jgi:hypothetical protein
MMSHLDRVHTKKRTLSNSSRKDVHEGEHNKGGQVVDITREVVPATLMHTCK